MRLNTADGEVTASERLKVPLRSPTTAGALIMKGCPNIWTLGKRCMEEGSSRSIERKKPVLKSLDGQSFELDIENYLRRYLIPGESLLVPHCVSETRFSQ